MKTGREWVSRPPVPPPPSALSGGGCSVDSSPNRKNILEKIRGFVKSEVIKISG